MVKATCGRFAGGVGRLHPPQLPIAAVSNASNIAQRIFPILSKWKKLSTRREEYATQEAKAKGDPWWLTHRPQYKSQDDRNRPFFKTGESHYNSAALL
jgi:hypothetical protein